MICISPNVSNEVCPPNQITISNLIHWIKNNNEKELFECNWLQRIDLSLEAELFYHFYEKERNLSALEFLLEKNLDSDLALNEEWTLLTLACSQGDFEVVRLLLDFEVNVNLKNPKGLTPLHYACQNKDLEMIKLLLERNGDIRPVFESVYANHEDILKIFVSKAASFYFMDILSEACSVGNLERLKRLVHLGFVIEVRTPEFIYLLRTACGSNQPEIVRYLLDPQEEIDLGSLEIEKTTTCLMLAAYANTTDEPSILDYLIKKGARLEATDEKGNTALHYAISNQRRYGVRLVEFLLEQGADPNHQNIRGQTPLHWAYEEKKPWVISLLLRKNASINLPDDYGQSPFFKIQDYDNETEKVTLLKEAFLYQAEINRQNIKGETSLYRACLLRSEGAVQLLLNQGSSTKISDRKGWTPLHIACKVGDLPCVKQLIQHKASLNVSTRNGNTPLHVACLNKKAEIVKYLLKEKADKTLQNGSGKTILDLANERNLQEIKEIIDEME